MQWLSSTFAAFAMLFAGFLPHAHVVFGGDMMFDRTVRTAIEAKGGDFIFGCIDPVLSKADLVVGNLEGPITGNPSQSVGSEVGSPDNFVFTFPPSTASLLAAHHVGIVNLGNNHILNFGNDGVRSTIAALKQAHVGYFGDPISSTVATTSVNGIRLAFINYNEYQSPEKGGTSASTTVSQIRSARAAGEVPIVYTHWGVEYATSAPAYVQTLGHEFVDAGAALIVGSSPHVVEESEVYHGVYIYYSLGNFIFDQYWNDAVDHGLLIDVDITSAGVASVQEIPVVLEHNRQTCPQ